jgi:exodeoxyribonuclease VII small subunit
MAAENCADKNFETALQELETIVEKLESGELSLEDSLAAFESGVGLVKYCNQKLNEVESKVQLLLKDKNGKFQFKVFVSMSDDGEREESES